MENLFILKNNKDHIRLFSYTLIFLSLLVFGKFLFGFNGIISMVELQLFTKSFKSPVDINFTLFYTIISIEFLLNAVIFVSAIFVISYKESSRRILVYTLIFTILFLIITPILKDTILPHRGISSIHVKDLNTNYVKSFLLIVPYIWLLIKSIFFVLVIRYFTRVEVRKAFH